MDLPGHAYVYFTYGNHWMLNVVTEHAGLPGCRAHSRRYNHSRAQNSCLRRRHARDTFGPGKLTQAMGITKAENGADLVSPSSRLRIEAGDAVPNSLVTKGPTGGFKYCARAVEIETVAIPGEGWQWS